jgi:hypothetical protein
MNLNGDEKRIQQLFRELSLEDGRRAPSFAGVLAAANSGIAHSRYRFRSLRFAMAAAMVCAAVLIAMAIIVNSSKPRDARDDQAALPAPQPAATAGILPSNLGTNAPAPEPRKTAVKHSRHRRPSHQTEIATKSLFAWQSPTASLLRTPDDELLKSLPRLGESLQTIKFYSPDEFN